MVSGQWSVVSGQWSVARVRVGVRVRVRVRVRVSQVTHLPLKQHTARLLDGVVRHLVGVRVGVGVGVRVRVRVGERGGG